MNLQRNSIFDNDKTLEENTRDAISEIAEKPHKLSCLFWFFWIQICFAVFLLVLSALLPYFILHG